MVLALKERLGCAGGRLGWAVGEQKITKIRDEKKDPELCSSLSIN